MDTPNSAGAGLILGWFLQRDRILQIAQIRQGANGPFPVTGRDPDAQVGR